MCYKENKNNQNWLKNKQNPIRAITMEKIELKI